MTEADTPKTPREIWNDLLNEYYTLNDKDKEMMDSLSDEVIKLALESKDVTRFLKDLPSVDPNIGPKINPRELPDKYRAILNVLTERVRRRMRRV